MCGRSIRAFTPLERRARGCSLPRCKEAGPAGAVLHSASSWSGMPASFAANAFFPYASNGDLAVSMIRWLAEDTATPLLKPEAYSLPEMRLTHRQMQVTFLLVEVLLPLSVMLFGAAVWWRRR